MSAGSGRSACAVALQALAGVVLIGIGAGLVFVWSIEAGPLRWLPVCFALVSTLSGIYLAVSAGRGSRRLPAQSPTLAHKVISALSPAPLAGMVLLSEKSSESIALFSLGLGLGLLSLGLLGATLIKRVREKTQRA